MSGGQHTPGPWQAHPTNPDDDDSVFDWRTPIVGKCKHIGSFVQSGARDITEAQANAHLIAAAPELLAAGEAVLAYMDLCNDRGDLERNLRAAIAKAKGGAA